MLLLSRRVHAIEVIIFKSFSSRGMNWFYILFLEFGEIPSLSSIEKFCFNPSLPLFVYENMPQKAGIKILVGSALCKNSQQG